MSEEDTAFQKRIERSIETVTAWDSDEELLRRCREKIPWEELRRDLDTVANKDPTVSCEHVFLKRLAKHFQSDVMTWINAPPCRICSKTESMESRDTRKAATDEEESGQASRVEVYECTVCKQETTFPRYNSTSKLMETCSGRCGEYANLFGLYCRAAGLETRYILDLTDHVWTEVRLEDTWIMIDSCEGVTDEYSMYESGWGKKLSYILAIGVSHIVDVTPKYTRQFRTDDFQARRRAITSSEAAGENIIRGINKSLQQKLSEKEAASVRAMVEKENELMGKEKSLSEWDRQYQIGRMSGSLEWRSSRRETGTEDDGSESISDRRDSVQYSYRVAGFYPFRGTLRISVYPNRGRSAITVNGSSCALGIADAVSIVVLDETFLGCVLQSKCFTSLIELELFLSSIPKGRIVAITGKLHVLPEEDKTMCATLPGFQIPKGTTGFVYVGQKGYKPEWETFSTSTDCILLESGPQEKKSFGIRTSRSTMANSICGRIPERLMPLQTQKLASHEQKRKVFESFVESHDGCFGYITKPGSPVYLLNESAYPFTADDHNDPESAWTTCLVLPKKYVPSHDVGIQEAKKSGSPMYEVPLDEEFFVRSLGPTLMERGAAVGTASVLRNARFVGLYFSAHWCGPCRSFTPMLTEMYCVLKDEFPTHGLEIVFVTSDRNQTEFQNYFASMPWLALPFGSLQKQILSSVYSVRGIPSLVILDALSGQVVIPASETRQEVQRACNFGDSGIISMINNWFERVPTESKELIKMLESSCEPNDADEEPLIPDEFLVSSEFVTKQAAADSLVAELMEDGMDEQEAREAAIAVQDACDEEMDNQPLEPGPLNHLLKRVSVETNPSSPKDARGLLEEMAVSEGRDKVQSFLSTTRKYLVNCAKSPWTTKFRRIQFGFRMASIFTSIKDGVQVLERLGFLIEPSADDYTALIPVYADVSAMIDMLDTLIEAHRHTHTQAQVLSTSC